VERVKSLSIDAAEEVLSARRRRDAKRVLEVAQAVAAIAFGDKSTSTGKQESLIHAATSGLLRPQPSTQPTE
jgi:hypothetical protein